MSILSDVIARGTRAAQPVATAVSAGSLYFVTDELVTERSNGTAWQDFSGSGGATATTARGLRSAQPAATAVPDGFLYFVTDEDKIERSNATAWETYSAAPGGGGGGLAAAAVPADESQASNTSYANLTTVGPSVTMTVTGTTAAVWIGAKGRRPGGGGGFTGMVGIAISGATTLAPDFTSVVSMVGSVEVAMLNIVFLSGITPGVNTFTLKYRNDGGGTWNFRDRYIQVSAP